MRVENLKNIGPKTAAWLHDTGIHTRADLEAMGAVMAYKILKHQKPKQVTILLLYALDGALSGKHWNVLGPERKAALKREADTRLHVAPSQS